MFRNTVRNSALLLLIFTRFVASDAHAQVTQVRNLDSSDFVHRLDALREEFSYRKTTLPEFESVIYATLSYFPELDSTRIMFKKAKIKTSLNARPTMGSVIFRKRENRNYVIRIKPNNGDSVATLDQADFNAVIGVLGHELSHIVDYSQRGFFGIVGRLLSYTNKKGKRKYEAEIDQMTIDRGLGWQVYAWEDFVLNKSKATAKYKAYKRSVYYTEEEIRVLIEESMKPEPGEK
jgi:hypothetical protein